MTDITVFSSGRVNVIPFERHFSENEQDKNLKKKLAQPENLSGILNWCLEGLRLFREKGLAPPASVIEATKQYQWDSDKISRFIEEMMEPDVYGEIRTEEAYNAYQEWCIRNGQRSESFPAFKQSMEAHTEIKRKRSAGSGRESAPYWFILGMKWKCVQPIYSPFAIPRKILTPMKKVHTAAHIPQKPLSSGFLLCGLKNKIERRTAKCLNIFAVW